MTQNKIKKRIIIISVVILVVLCGGYWFFNNTLGAGQHFVTKWNGDVYFREFSELNWFYHPIPGVDSKTFQPLSKTSDYAKDSKNVYYRDKVVPQADRDTFRLFTASEILAPTDSNAAHYSKYFAKDKNKVFYNGNTIQSPEGVAVDVSSFALLDNPDYVKDRNHVYIFDTVSLTESKLILIKGANPATFVVYKNTAGVVIGSDDKRHYWQYHPLPPLANPNAIQVVGGSTVTLRDNNYVYCLSSGNNTLEILKGVDPSHFIRDRSVEPKGFSTEDIFDAFKSEVFTDGQEYYNGRCQEIEVQPRSIL